MRGPIAQATIRTSFVLGLRLLVQAGALLLVARLLGPEQFGVFAGAAALAVMMGTLSTFGTHLVLLGEVSKNPTCREKVLAYAVPTTLLCGGLLLAIYLLTCTLVFHGGVIALHLLTVIGITEILLQPLFGLYAMERLALGYIAGSQLLTTLPLALRLAAAVAVLLLRFSDPLTAYAYGYLLASLIAVAFAGISMSTPWPRPADWRLARKAELRDAAGYAALGLTANSPNELDKTIAAKLLPYDIAGVYSAGARVIGAVTLPVIAMLLSALPRLFREAQDRPETASRLLYWIFGAALSYSVMLATVLWLSAPAFDLIFGTKYHGLDQMIRLLCIAIPGMALRMAAGSVLMALGRPWMRVGFELTGLVVLMAASAFLISHFNVMGMPLALSVTEWVMAVLGMALAWNARPNRNNRHTISTGITT